MLIIVGTVSEKFNFFKIDQVWGIKRLEFCANKLTTFNLFSLVNDYEFRC